MTAPDRMPEAFENSLHDAGHPHMEPPANPERFNTLKVCMGGAKVSTSEGCSTISLMTS